ncbi:MAG: alpha-L-fucosidase [bacterium]
MRTRLLLLAFAVLLPSATTLAQTPRRRALCPDAQYAVVGAPLAAGAATSATVEIGARAGLGGLCPLAGAVVSRTTVRGTTVVRARWETCPGMPGPVTLRARLVDGCTRLFGEIRAPGMQRRVEALRADCGDGILDADAPALPYAATLESLATHPLPRWFDDAKFGIMIHWGIFTIPAWAETVIDPREWLTGTRLIDPPDYGSPFFTHIPYTEWYSNTILIDGSPAQQHHLATYGPDLRYEDFRPQFEAAASAWSGEAWADAFRDAGAKYVVLVTKHHDGFALWPTTVPHPKRADWHMARDVVGELSSAVRRDCMRMGLYYSGGFDWSVQPGPVRNSFDALTVAPQTPEYIAYAGGQWRELIDRYRPAVLWNDIGYPNNGKVLDLFADYYNRVPDGVINDRFSLIAGLTHHDYVTPEYAVLADISTTKFETVRGMGRGFGYNQNEHDADLDSAQELIELLIDVVSKNGNLLLNVGPLADGTIPVEQASRLRAIGAWLGVNGEAIFASRPWTRAAGVTSDGTPLRFTSSADGHTVYAFVLGPLPATGTITLVNVPLTPSSATLLGASTALTATPLGNDLRISLPPAVATQTAYTFALRQ